MMNKKAETTVWTEFIKAIPSVLVILILIGAMVSLWNALHPDQHSIEQKDIARIIGEIQDLKVSGDKIILPVFSSGYDLFADKSLALKSKFSGTGCYKDYCLCFAMDTNNLICDSFNIRDWEDIDKADYKDISFEASGVLVNNSLLISRSNKKITILKP